MERFLTFGNEQVEVFDNSEEQVRFVPDDHTETVKSLMFKPSGKNLPSTKKLQEEVQCAPA